MFLCDYGCGQEGKYKFKNGKWCCSKSFNSCPINRTPLSTSRKNAHSKKMKEMWDDKNSKFNSEVRKEKLRDSISKSWKNPESRLNSKERNKKIRDGLIQAWNNEDSKFNSTEFIKKQQINQYLTIEKIKIKYSLFYKIEDIIRGDEAGKFKVRCKNNNCENSKEKSGWFTPTYIQLYERIRQLENKDGNGGSYFYCSDFCKNTCPLYYLRSDPYKDTELPYTHEEIEIWRVKVKELDNNQCQICGSTENIHIHHIIPVKLEPFFALDPSNGICLCDECHFKYGHKTGTECSTGNLANIICK